MNRDPPKKKGEERRNYVLVESLTKRRGLKPYSKPESGDTRPREVRF